MLYKIIFLVIFLFAVQSDSYAQHKSKTHLHNRIKKTKHKRKYQGTASYYSDEFVGKKTANGEVFSQDKLTAACNILPLGTCVLVTNLSNGKTVQVKINDRLARHSRRLIDLTKAAAREISFMNKGVTKVKIEVMKK